MSICQLVAAVFVAASLVSPVDAALNYNAFIAAVKTDTSTLIDVSRRPDAEIGVNQTQSSVYGATVGPIGPDPASYRGEIRVEWNNSANLTVPGLGSPVPNHTVDYDPTFDASNNWIYKTFCVERGEDVLFSNISNSTGLNQYKATIDSVAYFGTNLNQPIVNNYPAGAPISDQTKVLYGLYFQGRLDDVFLPFRYGQNATSGDADDWLIAIQNVIWNREDVQPAVLTDVDSILLSNWLSANYSTYLSAYQNTVRVLNLWTTDFNFDPSISNAAQSLLVYDPDALITNPVPEPASMVLWGIGACVAGFASFRRRRIQG